MPKLAFPARKLFRFHKGRDHTHTETPDEAGLVDDREPSGNEKHSLVEPLKGGFQDSPPRGPGALPRNDALVRTKSFSPWIAGDYFICISVKEGLDLGSSVAVRPSKCDSFVRVTLQRPNSLPFGEAETRVLARTCFPMWEECLPFPLNNMPEDTVINLRVLDKDIGHFNFFLGIVSLPLKDALAATRSLGHEKIYRMPLLDRNGNVRKRAELVFGVSVVAQHEYREMRAVITAIQDPDQVHDCLGDYSLYIKLHGVRELMGINSSLLNSLKAEFHVCSTEVRRHLVGTPVAGGMDLDDVEVVVPLGPAFRGGDTLKGKTRAQFGEVKVELMCGKARLAKTQIPIWDVPFRPENLAMPGAVAGDGKGAGVGAGGESSDSEEEGEEGPGATSDEDSDSDQRSEIAASEGNPADKKTFLCNITANIASAVAATALVRSFETSAIPSALRHSDTTQSLNGPKSLSDASVVSKVSDLAGGSRPAGPSEGGAMGGAAAQQPERPSDVVTATPTSSMALGANGDAGSPASSPGQATPPPPAAPPALWNGKRYIRPMERLDRNLARAPVLILSMQLVKTPPAAEEGSLARGSGGLTLSRDSSAARSSLQDFGAADVESPDAPLAVPAPLGTAIMDFVVCAGPHAVARDMFAEGAEIGLRVMALEKMTELKVSPWGPDPEGKALMMRTLHYNKPTVVGPTAVTAIQKIMTKADGGFVMVQYVMPNVPPVGQAVKVEVQVVAQHAGPGRTRMSVSLAIHWLKGGMVVNMLKGKVEDGSPKDTRKYFETLKQQLSGKYGTLDEATGLVSAPRLAAVAESQVAVASAAADAASVVPYGAGGAAGLAGAGGLGAAFGLPLPAAAVTGVFVILVVLLLLVLLRVSGELGASQRALAAVSQELRVVGKALAAVAAQLPAAAAAAGAGSGAAGCPAADVAGAPSS